MVPPQLRQVRLLELGLDRKRGRLRRPPSFRPITGLIAGCQRSRQWTMRRCKVFRRAQKLNFNELADALAKTPLGGPVVSVVPTFDRG